MKNTEKLILGIDTAAAKSPRAILKVLNSLNSCDALWVCEHMKKFSKKSQEYLTNMKVSVIMK